MLAIPRCQTLRPSGENVPFMPGQRNDTASLNTLIQHIEQLKTT